MTTWKEINGWPGYNVSDEGQVASKRGLMKPYIRAGYPSVQLCCCGKKKNFLVHRLVAEAFYGPIVEGKVVNHKDGLKTNNRVSNIEVVSPSENTKHAYRSGLITISDTMRKNAASQARKRRKLPPETVLSIRSKYTGAHGEIARFSREFGVNSKSVLKIIRGEFYADISNNGDAL